MALLSFRTARAGEDATEPIADLQAIQNAFEALAKKAAPSVVTIKSARWTDQLASSGPVDAGPRRPRMPGRRVYGAGSGVIIDANGLVLTNEHVVHQAGEIIVFLNDGQELSASIVQTDARSDLAVLRVDATGLQPAVLGDVADLRQGHMVFAMGNPFGVASTVGRASMSWGLVSALGRPLPLLGAAEDRYYGNLIETTAAINPGNSGGPLFDIHGRVVGITTAISTRTGKSEGVGFAVPISRRTRLIIGTLMKGQQVEYGLLGVFVKDPSDEERKQAGGPKHRGAVVDALEAGSPAQQAELRPGDLIAKFDGQDVLDADHLVRMVGSSPPGHVVDILFYRDRKPHSVRTTLVRRDRGIRKTAGPVHWRGLSLEPITPQTRRHLSLTTGTKLALHGVIIVNVGANSQADSAGLRPGMVLGQINDRSVPTIRELRHLIRCTEGQPVDITVYGGKRFRLPPD